MIIEIWKSIPIKDFEGWYEASSLGNIRRNAKHLPKKRGRSGNNLKIQARPPARSQRSKNRPIIYRPKVQLLLNYRTYTSEVGHLVAMAFHGFPKPGHQCNHKDGNPWNNKPSNLEWVTRTENMRHAHANRLLNLLVGEEQKQSKLTEEAVRKIRASSDSQRILGKRYGVSKTAIQYVQKGITWKHV